MADSSKAVNKDTTPSDAAGKLRITVFGASNVPGLSFFHKNSKAFVTLRALDQTWSTKVAERSGSPRWDEEFDLRGEDPSVLQVELKLLRRRFVFSRREQLIGAVEVGFKELWEKQRQAHKENSDYADLDLQVASSSESHPSISIRVHRGLAAPKPVLEKMRMGPPPLPTLPAGVSDAEAFAQDAIEAAGSVTEVKAFYDSTLASVEVFVKMVDAFADIHPYAKAAWTVLSAGYKSMTTALNLISRWDKTAIHKDDRAVILQVAKKTNECALFIKAYTSTESFALRTAKGIFSNSGDEIARFKKDFDLVRRKIDTGAILSITEGLSKVNDELYGVEESVKLVGQNVERVAQNAIVDKLPYAEGATWDPGRVVLPDTREALLEDIWQWVKRSDAGDGAKIFCLTGAAGSGKSAIAHTVARRCYEEGLLASSFFFSRDVADRNNPRKLLSTMARDLARDPRIREQISVALEADQSLATAPLSRQFGPLIQEPCLQYPSDTPKVAVIDGLDEGYSVDLLKLLRDGVPKLPQSFRLFITSREMESIELYLSKSAHVHLQTIDLDAGANQGDIRTYVQSGVRDIAETHNLGESWPGEELIDKLCYMAGGLFQWVSAILQALEISYDPATALVTLLSGLQTGLGAEERMDEIYAKILQAYNWNDPDFKRDYDAVMGAILALKSPLSVSALQSLHPGIPNVSKLLSRLGALLTGWRHPNQPVRVLHLSLRDFLTARVSSDMPFFISEKDHSRRLGPLCLAFLNENLRDNTPGVGYLRSNLPGIPAVAKSQVSEELWYACEFWTAHIFELEAPAPAEVVELLRNFLSTRSIWWMEICTSVDTFQEFRGIRTWIQGAFPDDVDLLNNEFNTRLAAALVNMSTRLSYMDRREESLLASQEAVELYRQLAEGRPAAFNPDLARALNTLSIRLAALGQREDALAAVRESVSLYRPLAEDRPATYNLDLARSLNTLSNWLSDLGQREDALAAAQEAVTVHRQLVADRPSASKSDLALSLNTLSNQLSGLGQREGALDAIRESVTLYRQLAEGHPVTYNPNLARSLNSFSIRLSALGHREDALAAVQESVALRRQLAVDRPAAFSSDLARSLNNLSIWLSVDPSQRENALTAVQEAVALYRQLTKDRPAAFNPSLAQTLNTLSIRLSALGQREDALAAVREAVALYRQLAKDRPAVFNPDLASSLYNLARDLSALKHREDSLEAANEAVELYRPLADNIPAVYKPKLVNALWQLSISLRNLGREEDAVAAKKESDMLKSP
ncbi:hypothetical protein BOTBODRAFT_184552 [Botryobasidium botryosum FD-172 SS1]|uniref:C2 domain-containing protein n=1 Tax=Botryobasidium botryosum (strain FD-172 SS1) TaxID=930990 RepID=A0A067N610_BOTB1|nr:hypothetical protein BOTBODRAFT_184552 [Botryobasidium botryosum FD-172 SS1]